jgi:hypothetical protein
LLILQHYFSQTGKSDWFLAIVKQDLVILVILVLLVLFFKKEFKEQLRNGQHSNLKN